MALLFSEPQAPPPSAPEWTVTYADMVTLLLTLFVMLVSVSEINREGSYQDMVQSVQSRFGISGHAAATTDGLRSRNASLANALVGSRGERDMLLQGRRAENGSNGPNSPRSLLATIPWPEDAVELTMAAHDSLADVAARTTGIAGAIEIRGLAGGGRLDTACARAKTCRNQLISLGIDPRRLKIAAAEQDETASPPPEGSGSPQAAGVELYLLDAPEISMPAK